MQCDLTPAQIEFYRHQVFLVVENFLNPTELERWRAVTNEAVAQRLDAAKGQDWERAQT